MIVYQRPGLRGIELWHGLRGPATLFSLRHSKREYFTAMREFLVQLHSCHARAPDPADNAQLHRAAGFDRVCFAGGDAGHPHLVEAMNRAGLPFTVDTGTPDPFAAAAGAREILSELGWHRGAALDLGQTGLKVIAGSARVRIPRDEALLPYGPHALTAELGRERLRDLLRRGLAETGGADGIVLGLPVALDHEGGARSSTYPGLWGPVEHVFRGLFDVPWAVVNDAVLTARGLCPAAKRKTLVLTLGFGVGGALWET